MTVKEAMMKVSEDLAAFPKGWNTELKEVFRKDGKDLYERKQKRIWTLVVLEPGADEPIMVSSHRSYAGAKKAMEDDIKDTIAHRDDRYGDADFERDGDDSARIGTFISWEVTEETLYE